MTPIQADPPSTGSMLYVPGCGFLTACPWVVLTCASVAEVRRAWVWSERRELSVAYPWPTVSLLDAIASFSAGVDAGHEAQREEMRRESESATSNHRSRAG